MAASRRFSRSDETPTDSGVATARSRTVSAAATMGRGETANAVSATNARTRLAARRDKGRSMITLHDSYCFVIFMSNTGGACGIAAPSCLGSEAPKWTPSGPSITACP